MAPGAIALQVMRCGASSMASARIRPSRPDLDAETWQRLGVPTWVEMPDGATKAPPPRATICGTIALPRQEGAVERHRQDLAPFVERHVEERSLPPQAGVRHGMSTPPNASAACAARRGGTAGSDVARGGGAGRRRFRSRARRRHGGRVGAAVDHDGGAVAGQRQRRSLRPILRPAPGHARRPLPSSGFAVSPSCIGTPERQVCRRLRRPLPSWTQATTKSSSFLPLFRGRDQPPRPDAATGRVWDLSAGLRYGFQLLPLSLLPRPPTDRSSATSTSSTQSACISSSGAQLPDSWLLVALDLFRLLLSRILASMEVREAVRGIKSLLVLWNPFDRSAGHS